MRRLPALAAAAALLGGCAAHMIESHGDKVQLFKTGLEKPGKGGVMQYLANGLPAWKKARRADADKQMARFCGQAGYTITEEGPRSKVGTRAPVGSHVTVEMDENWYVLFECKGG